MSHCRDLERLVSQSQSEERSFRFCFDTNQFQEHADRFGSGQARPKLYLSLAGPEYRSANGQICPPYQLTGRVRQFELNFEKEPVVRLGETEENSTFSDLSSTWKNYARSLEKWTPQRMTHCYYQKARRVATTKIKKNKKNTKQHVVDTNMFSAELAIDAFIFHFLTSFG